MVVDRNLDNNNDDEEANNLATHHELLRNRMAIQNNVVNKRKEQLRNWESSAMNKLPAVRKPPSTSHVKFQDSDIFFSACVSGDEDEVEDLLYKGANVNTSTIDGVTALHQAVIDNKFEMVRFLVNKRADINAQDNEGWTPLHAAVCCGNILIVRFLCDHGADITVANSDKELAVDLAEDDEIKAYLEEKLALKGVTADECRGYEERTIMRDCMDWIRAGSYLDKPHSKTGATALHVAASKGYNKLISLLVQAGADVHAQDFEGWTPLHAAAHWGEKDACRILINRGAGLNKRTIMGQDVLQVADASIVEFLEQISPSSNTSSSISSIQTRSRSITPEDEASSSSLYSSDQSVAFTVKIPSTTQAPSNTTNSTATTQSSTASDKQTISSSNNTANSTPSQKNAAPLPVITKSDPPKEPPPVPPKSTTPRIASPPSESVSTVTESSSSSATMSSRRPRADSTNTITPPPAIQRINAHLTTPTIASATRQKPTMVRSGSATTTTVTLNCPSREIQPSNPWVKHWRAAQSSAQLSPKQPTTPNGQLQRAPSVASSTSSTATESVNSTPATSPAPGFRPSAISQPIQPSPAYKKYAQQQVRSWQTPPQQPTPQKESEAERKAKSRLQRASRRSTQGVTLDQLNEARSAASSPTVNSPATTPTGTKTEDIGKWKSSALQQQSNKIVSSREPSTSSELTSSTSATSASHSTSSNSLKPTVTGSISSMSKQTAPTLAVETPSAARMPRRRSDLRSSRNGTSDSEMLTSSSLSTSTTTGRDQKASSTSQVEDGTKSPTAIVQPMQSTAPTPPLRDLSEKSSRISVPLQDRVNSIDEEAIKESLSDDSFKPPPVIPRTMPPGSLPKSDSFQNGVSNDVKDATFGSTGDSHYKQLYEKAVIENERLRKQVDDLKQSRQKDQSDSLLSNGSSNFITVRKNFGNNANSNSSGGSHSPSPTATPSTGNSAHLDETDRRTYERKIAELEYELQKAKQLQSDHKRLKDENNALIRVISKLSKDYPRQTTNSTTPVSNNSASTGAQTKSNVQTKTIAKENTKQLSFQNN